MGVDLVLLCDTCKVYHYTGDRNIFTLDGAKKLSGKVGVMKIGKVSLLIREMDKTIERLERRGLIHEYVWPEVGFAKQRLQRVLDFLVRHSGHRIVVTTNAGDTWWDDDVEWKEEE